MSLLELRTGSSLSRCGPEVACESFSTLSLYSSEFHCKSVVLATGPTTDLRLKAVQLRNYSQGMRLALSH